MQLVWSQWLESNPSLLSRHIIQSTDCYAMIIIQHNWYDIHISGGCESSADLFGGEIEHEQGRYEGASTSRAFVVCNGCCQPIPFKHLISSTVSQLVQVPGLLQRHVGCYTQPSQPEYFVTWFNLIVIWSPTANIPNLHCGLLATTADRQLYMTKIDLILIPYYTPN